MTIDPKPVLLITGGTGFLGRALAKHYQNTYRVILGARNNGLNFLAQTLTGCEVCPLDITSPASVRDVFSQYKPDYVIHAAATKFVDLSERFPNECLDVNILGSQNVARACIEFKVQALIGVSTDKASPPCLNLYSISKAAMERTFCLLSSSTTRIACVRFGNIAWSTGSVFPIWKSMHESTGVIGSTGYNMRRFFITVDHAVRIVDTTLANIDSLAGCTVTSFMKCAQISDILDVWIAQHGGSWTRLPARPGDQLDEDLIGLSEFPFSTITTLNGSPYIVFTPNQKSPNPITDSLSSHNMPRLNAAEIADLILYPS